MDANQHHERCPRCRAQLRLPVKDSRPSPAGRRRRKVCGACGHRWSTIEIVLPESTRIKDAATFDPFAAVREALDDTMERLRAIRASIPEMPNPPSSEISAESPMKLGEAAPDGAE